MRGRSFVFDLLYFSFLSFLIGGAVAAGSTSVAARVVVIVVCWRWRWRWPCARFVLHYMFAVTRN